jgi:serine/threonine-protein kinase
VIGETAIMSTVKRLARIGAVVLAFLAVTAVTAYFTLNYIVRGTETQVVPDLTGKDVVSVLELLSGLDLNTKIGGLQYSADIPANHVISQDPVAGNEVKKGRSVRIVLSRGPATVQVPNLRGLSLDQAETLLEGNGLCRGRLSRAHGSPVAAGMVAAQAPPAGRKVTRGACVDLLVSLGPRRRAVIMPDLHGMGLQEAVALLESDDLTTGRISYDYDRRKPPEGVIGQKPAAGHRVVLNTAVDLRISRRAPGTRPPDADTGHLFRYRVANGFLKKHIRVAWKTASLTTDLFDAFVKPGRELWLLVPSRRDGTLLLYLNGQLVSARFYPAG